MRIFQPIVTSSLNVQDTVTAVAFSGSLYGTASWAISASHAINAINAQSSSNFTVTNTLKIDGSETNVHTVLSTTVGSNNLYTIPTGSYTAAFGKYTIYKGANARAGEFITAWNSNLPVVYTDTSTTDIGNTSDISFTATIVSGEIQVNADALSSGWYVKMLATFI
jgi:hypothetical protein